MLHGLLNWKMWTCRIIYIAGFVVNLSTCDGCASPENISVRTLMCCAKGDRGTATAANNHWMSPMYGDVQSQTTKDCHFDWGWKAHRNGPIFVRSSSAFKKELIAHFLEYLANCLWYHWYNCGAYMGWTTTLQIVMPWSGLVQFKGHIAWTLDRTYGLVQADCWTLDWTLKDWSGRFSSGNP